MSDNKGKGQAKRDPGWLAFSRELNAGMRADRARGLPELTNADLERLLLLEGEVDVEQWRIRRWRTGGAHPRLSQVPRISRIVGMGTGHRGEHDPAFILRHMGLLDSEASATEGIELAQRLSKLQLKYQDSLARQAGFARSFGAANLVNVGVRSGKWAVAVWPAIAGPDECRMHVADRIDFRRTDGTPTNDGEVWADPELRTALRDTYAVRVKTRLSARKRWVAPGEEGASSWSISHVGSPMSSIVTQQHQGLRSVAVLSVSVQSWCNDVGSMIAFALGYGMTLTRDLASEISGRSPGSTTYQDRAVIHSELLKRSPRLHVWSHHAPPDEDGIRAYLEPADSSTAIVFIREHDDLLRRHADRRDSNVGTVSFRELLKRRDAITEACGALGGQVLVLEAKALAPDDEVHRRRQVLEHSREALDYLERRYALNWNDIRQYWPAVRKAHPQTGAPYLSWLSQQLEQRSEA